MRWTWGWAALGLLVITAAVSAGDGEPLPPELATHIKHEFGAEPLHARKELEGGRACYVVTVAEKGRAIELYASPDGRILARKPDAFSLSRWLDRLAEGALFLLLPLVVAGALTRGVVSAVRGRPLPPPAGWLAAWSGAAVGMAVVVFNLATVPREKDVPVLGGYCALWAAVAASAVEVVILAVRSGREDGIPRRRWIAACVVVAAVSLALTVPLDILRIEREDRYFKQLTLRPLPN